MTPTPPRIQFVTTDPAGYLVQLTDSRRITDTCAERLRLRVIPLVAEADRERVNRLFRDFFGLMVSMAAAPAPR